MHTSDMKSQHTLCNNIPHAGAPYKETPGSKPHKFAEGDHVRVQVEVDVFKMMQEGHGGWNDQMASVS